MYAFIYTSMSETRTSAVSLSTYLCIIIWYYRVNMHILSHMVRCDSLPSRRWASCVIVWTSEAMFAFVWLHIFLHLPLSIRWGLDTCFVLSSPTRCLRNKCWIIVLLAGIENNVFGSITFLIIADKHVYKAKCFSRFRKSAQCSYLHPKLEPNYKICTGTSISVHAEAHCLNC